MILFAAALEAFCEPYLLLTDLDKAYTLYCMTGEVVCWAKLPEASCPKQAMAELMDTLGQHRPVYFRPSDGLEVFAEHERLKSTRPAWGRAVGASAAPLPPASNLRREVHEVDAASYVELIPAFGPEDYGHEEEAVARRLPKSL